RPRCRARKPRPADSSGSSAETPRPDETIQPHASRMGLAPRALRRRPGVMPGRCRCASRQSTNCGRSEAMGVPDAGRAGRALVRTARTIACCLAFSAALPAVSSADGRGPVTSLLEMRRDRVVVQQWDLSCGAAALATLLNYQHGDAVSEREVARGLIQREEYLEQPLLVQARQGFSLLDLKRYVE